MIHEIDVTDFYNNEDPLNYSNSIANSGLQNISEITWNNAKKSPHNFVNKKNRQTFIDYFKEFGAWDDLAEWGNNELNALFIQEISQYINEKKCFDTWEEYERSEQVLHNLFYVESEKKIYFTLSH